MLASTCFGYHNVHHLDLRMIGLFRVTSGVPQGSVLGSLLFLAYVTDIRRYMDSTIWPFADDYVIYRKIINNEDRGKLQKSLVRLGEWAVANEMKMNPSKCKEICFARARVNDPLNYSLMGTLIPEASRCKYLGIILYSELCWVDQDNYAVKKAWKALHFKMRILKKDNSNTKRLAYISIYVRVLNMGPRAGIRTGRDK